MTLEEVWCGYKSSISHLDVFYCVAFVNVPKEARTKLDSKGVKCIFIGYCQKTKGYILFNPINQYVIINCDVIFDKSKNFYIVTMVSRLDSGSKKMVLNQKLEMEDEIIPQQMQRKSNNG
jgi:hypothetical protein